MSHVVRSGVSYFGSLSNDKLNIVPSKHIPDTHTHSWALDVIQRDTHSTVTGSILVSPETLYVTPHHQMRHKSQIEVLTQCDRGEY